MVGYLENAFSNISLAPYWLLAVGAFRQGVEKGGKIIQDPSSEAASCSSVNKIIPRLIDFMRTFIDELKLTRQDACLKCEVCQIIN